MDIWKEALASEQDVIFETIQNTCAAYGCFVIVKKGGTTGNIIPDKLHFGGSCKDTIWQAVERAVNATCKNYHCSPVLQRRGVKE